MEQTELILLKVLGYILATPVIILGGSILLFLSLTVFFICFSLLGIFSIYVGVYEGASYYWLILIPIILTMDVIWVIIYNKTANPFDKIW